MTDQAPFPDRMRSLITTLVTAGHQLNMGQGQEALQTLASAGAQLGGLRAAVDLAHGGRAARNKKRTRSPVARLASCPGIRSRRK